MDRLDEVSVFLAVAEHGSFAQAARRLGRSPAVVTRAIADLELRARVRPFTRTTRAVNLTDVGQRFRVGAQRVLADFDEIEREAAGEGQCAPRRAQRDRADPVRTAAGAAGHHRFSDCVSRCQRAPARD